MAAPTAMLVELIDQLAKRLDGKRQRELEIAQGDAGSTRFTGTQALWPVCNRRRADAQLDASPTVTWKVIELLTVGFWMSVAQRVMWLVVLPWSQDGRPSENAVGGDGGSRPGRWGPGCR